MRLDRALARDVRTGLRSWPLRLFLLLQLVAAAVFVWRRGEEVIDAIVLIWLGMLVLAFLAWWAGRYPSAHPQPDRVSAAGPRAVFALVGAAGLTMWGFGWAAFGLVLLSAGLGGWIWAAWRTGGPSDLRARLTRDPRPFLPMMLLIALPKLLAIGPSFVVGAVLALPSGLGQQLFYLVGLFAPLEAASRRPAAAAVVAALVFALIHVPFNFEANDDDLLAAVANALLWQASVGLIAVLAYRRHRAVVPIGVTHALAIG